MNVDEQRHAESSVTHRPDSDGWFDDPAHVDRLCHILYGLCALALIAEFFIHKHGHFDFENWFGFHGWFGFASYCFLIFAAKLLRVLVKRDEGYYGD